MYTFVYVDSQKVPMEEHFPAMKVFVVNYNKISTMEPVPKNWLGFSYICSEDYKLDQEFYKKVIKEQSNHTCNDKVKLFRRDIVIIEEEWFHDNNLSDGATFLIALIKRAKK